MSDSAATDLTIWQVSEAPAVLRSAFDAAVEDGWIVELSSHLTETIDPTFEAALLCFFTKPLLARSQLVNGNTVLLFAP